MNYLKILFLCVLCSATSAFGQLFSGSGTYQSSDGQGIVGVTYLGGDTYEVTTISEDGTLVSAEVPDAEIVPFIEDTLGNDYIYTSEDSTTESGVARVPVEFPPSPNSNVVVGYDIMRIGPNVFFWGNIGNVRIGDGDPGTAVDDFYDFVDALGNFLDEGNEVAESSISGLEEMFQVFDDAIWGAFVDAVEEVVEEIMDFLENLLG